MRFSIFQGIRGITFAQKNLVKCLVLLIFKLTLDLVYLKAITPFYSYAGMTLNFSWLKYLLSLSLFIVLVRPIINLYNNKNLSSLIILLLNLLYFIPGCTLYSFAGFSDKYFLFFAGYWVLLIFLNRYITIAALKKLDYTSNKLLFYSTLFVISAGILYITGLYNQFNLHISLSDVYELRFAQRRLNLPRIINYFQPIAATLVPIAIVYCFIHLKIGWSIVLILIQLLSFAFGGMKMTLFFLVVAILAYCFYNEQRMKWLAVGFIFLNIIAFFEILIRNFSYVSGYILYRVLFIPNLLSYQFYDFFNKNELLYWRDSIFNRIGIASPYPYPVPNLIARVYYSDPNGSANNGLCGDAFANFGWLSLLIFPLIIVVFCKFLDACSKYVDSRILLSAAVVFAMGFTNISFFVLLLSNGFIFACILIYILPRQKSTFPGNDN